ncbi:hypothetical protein [Leptospira bouyouniensis]|uniref:hypothetical protein n=1 Tax=Leptospira bouyouniensis TaxID=2484911 RepID=UPI0010912473|nr:hypothetical protein [Leptospira bouyouniensis]TGM74583.1 hypothetical protein EHQ99_18140 [Leptospira bouyouniensis]
MKKKFPFGRIAIAISKAILKEGTPFILKKLDPDLKREIEKFELHREQLKRQEKIRNKLFPNAIEVKDYTVLENDN